MKTTTVFTVLVTPTLVFALLDSKIKAKGKQCVCIHKVSALMLTP